MNLEKLLREKLGSRLLAWYVIPNENRVCVLADDPKEPGRCSKWYTMELESLRRI